MKLEEKRKSLRIIIKRKKIMRTRQEAVEFGLTFKDTYVETPFRDANWQLVRVKKSKTEFVKGVLCKSYKMFNKFFSANCFTTSCIVSSTKFAYSSFDIVINLFMDLSRSGK